jgi:hypothetical protein
MVFLLVEEVVEFPFQRKSYAYPAKLVALVEMLLYRAHG